MSGYIHTRPTTILDVLMKRGINSKIDFTHDFGQFPLISGDVTDAELQIRATEYGDPLLETNDSDGDNNWHLWTDEINWVEIKSAWTRSLDPGIYHYGIRLADDQSPAQWHLAQKGTYQIFSRITDYHDDESQLEDDTRRATINTCLDNITDDPILGLLAHSETGTATPGETPAGSNQINAVPQIFSEGDEIGIVLPSGAYHQTTATDVTGATITLADSLPSGEGVLPASTGLWKGFVSECTLP